MVGKTLRWLLPATVALAAALPGCGGDDEPACPFPVFDVRAGTWATGITLWETGADSCQEGTLTMADTLAFCVFDPIGVDDPNLPGNFCCDVSRNGDEVSFSCTGSVTQACTESIVLEGSGIVSSTEIDLTLSFVQRFSGPDPCPVYTAPCTLWAGFSGTWLSEEGGCGESAGASPAPLSFPLSFEAMR
jgi:hypothetical protein